VLRDKSADPSAFADALHRVTALLLGAFFDRIEVKERSVSTGAGSMFTGIEATPVTTVAVHPIALELLDSAFHPYRPVCKRQLAQYDTEAGSAAAQGGAAAAVAGEATMATTQLASSSSSGSVGASASPPLAASTATVLPPSAVRSLSSGSSPLSPVGVSFTRVTVPVNLLESNILLFFPILTPADLPLLLSILADLLHARDAHASQLTLVCILIARPVLWAVAHKHPELLILATGVDELTQQNRMVPGISNWEERYHAAQ
jgi:uracil phosphoribosyltransferase